MFDCLWKQLGGKRVLAFESLCFVEIFDRFVPLEHEGVDEADGCVCRRILGGEDHRLSVKVQSLLILPHLTLSMTQVIEQRLPFLRQTRYFLLVVDDFQRLLKIFLS